MNFDEAFQEIVAFFDTAWNSLTPVAWSDIDFTIPKAGTWVRFDSKESPGEQISIGSPGANIFRHYGIVTVQVFQPLGQGSKDAREKATTALGAFLGKVTANGVHFQDSGARTIGNDGAGFYQINVTANFYYDEIT